MWREVVRVKADYARKHADIIGMAASMQMISTRIGPNVYGSTWNVTGKGLAWLNEKEDQE